MENVISVIMPVYNVESYIRQSIESVCGQTYKALEIILVDDGSTDGSGAICDEYAKKDERIKVVHQKNGGAANAKNTGLRLATGEYLAFLDSDDYLEKDAYMFMVKQLNDNNADIVQCGFYNVFCNKKEEKLNFSDIEILDEVSYLELFTKDWTCGLLWDKLYRREIFNGIYFEEGHKIDDEFFTYKGVMNAKKIIRIPKFIYNYRQRLSGVMLSESSQEKIIIDTLEYLMARRKLVVKKYPQLKKKFDEHYLNMLLILSTKKYVSRSVVLRLKEALNEYFKEKAKIKISLSLWKNLKLLQYTSIEKILSKKKDVFEEKRNLENYFR